MFQRMFVKGSIYKQIITGAGNSNQSDVEHNRRVIKKFIKKKKKKNFFGRRRFGLLLAWNYNTNRNNM